MNSNAPNLRLVGNTPVRPRPRPRPRPTGLTVREAGIYRRLTQRLTVAQAVDVATGRRLHGCSVAEQAILRLVIQLDEPMAVAA